MLIYRKYPILDIVLLYFWILFQIGANLAESIEEVLEDTQSYHQDDTAINSLTWSYINGTNDVLDQNFNYDNYSQILDIYELDNETLSERFSFPTSSPQESPEWAERPTQQPLRPPTSGSTGQSSKGCGVSSALRIAGGRPAGVGRWPWVAGLIRQGRVFCGGTLITDRHVLTAAHCVNRLRARDITVRLGDTDLSTPISFPNTTGSNGGSTHRVQSIRQHTGFEPTSYEHDIAILKLVPPIAQFSWRIAPACLPPLGRTWENDSAVVVGWGSTYFGGPVSTASLREVSVPVWTQQKCSSAFTKQRIEGTVLCAAAPQGGKDSCQGDSGGPLVHRLRSNGRWCVIGVVSWGIRCGEPKHPGVYTRVNAYLDWIVRNAVF